MSANGGQLYRQGEGVDPGVIGDGFQPFLAPATAQAFGSWSLIELTDARKQWAYAAQPLYVMSDALAAVNEGADDLPSGWVEATYEPGSGLVSPPEIEVRSNARVNGSVLVDGNGMTLYFHPGDVEAAERNCTGACGREWIPLRAAALAGTIGHFRPVDRRDGVRQWEYRGMALFTSVRDVAPQDANGVVGNRGLDWRFALLEQYYKPQNVAIQEVFPFGPILTTAGGLPLYTRNRMEGNLQTSVNFRGAFQQSYETGKAIGTGGCDADCLKSWHPLEAPSEAHAFGYWEIMLRPDGRRQWAYKGFALYTFAGDTPGLVKGNNLYDPDEGDLGRYQASALPEALRSERTGAYFWHVAEAD